MPRAMLAFSVFLCLVVQVQGDLLIQGFDTNKHDRFANDAINFVGKSHDWSGVGVSKDNGRWATMISPSVFLTSNHAIPSGSLRFYLTNDDENGGFVDMPIASTKTSGRIGNTDLYVGMLQSPLETPNKVAQYPLASMNSPNDLASQTTYVFGRSNPEFFPHPRFNSRLGRNQIDQFIRNQAVTGQGAGTADVFLYDFDAANGIGADEAYIRKGDSGGPTFLMVGGQPVLAGIHWFNEGDECLTSLPGECSSGDTNVASYLSEIDAKYTAFGLDGTESFRFVAVPEPSAFLLLLLVSIGTAFRCKFLRHSVVN